MKYTIKTMDVMDYLLVIKVNYKKTVISTTIHKSLFVKQIALIFSLFKTAFFTTK